MAEKRSRETCMRYHNDLCGYPKCHAASCDEYTPIPENPRQDFEPPRIPAIDRIIEQIATGIDPTTGEVFDVRLLIENTKINDAIRKLAEISIPGVKLPDKKAPRIPDEEVFERLRAWRYSVAISRGVPAFYIFTDRVLHNLAAFKPLRVEDLLSVKGIGEAKYKDFGKEIFRILRPDLQ